MKRKKKKKRFLSFFFLAKSTVKLEFYQLTTFSVPLLKTLSLCKTIVPVSVSLCKNISPYLMLGLTTLNQSY